MNTLSKKDKKMLCLIGVSVVIMVFGILFLVNAMGAADFYPHFAAIDNVLAKYVVVILTMASGIMLFSNAALSLERDRLRNGLTIGITAFAFILTVPLTYVLISIMPFAASHTQVDVLAAAGVTSMGEMTPQAVTASASALGLNPIDGVMGVHNIYLGFASIFGEGGGLWAILAVLAVVGVVFLIEPLAAGICVVKGKQLVLFGKGDNGKFMLVGIGTLPVLKRRAQSAQTAEAETAETADEAVAETADVAADEAAAE